MLNDWFWYQWIWIFEGTQPPRIARESFTSFVKTTTKYCLCYQTVLPNYTGNAGTAKDELARRTREAGLDSDIKTVKLLTLIIRFKRTFYRTYSQPIFFMQRKILRLERIKNELALFNILTLFKQVDVHGVEQTGSDLYDLMSDRMLGGAAPQAHSEFNSFWPFKKVHQKISCLAGRPFCIFYISVSQPFFKFKLWFLIDISGSDFYLS